ncbi:MAG TPA: NB-ARC domain-containing protein [Ktedonosporobacter sp.]|nr:NB-ARC domain-containing protein [Ktedonosporobacter sp.]
MMMPKCPRQGELIRQLTARLGAALTIQPARIEGRVITRAVDYIAEKTGYSIHSVYRWGRGSCASEEVVEKLVRIGKEKAGFDRNWGRNLLESANHPRANAVVLEVFGQPGISSNLNFQHLATPFLGRQDEVSKLLSYLSPARQTYNISIDGIGGVGKTALALEVARQCFEASKGGAHTPGVPTFQAFIWVSAKTHYLGPGGMLNLSGALRTLSRIYTTIAHTLDRPEITSVPPEDQLPLVYDALGKQPTLLIIDNLDTMASPQEIQSFLHDVPPGVKVLITTRERAEVAFAPLVLSPLAQQDALDLIEKKACEQELQVSTEFALALYNRVGGIPLALISAIHQVADGISTMGKSLEESMKQVLDSAALAEGDISQFCFSNVVATLGKQSAMHHLFMTTALFVDPPLRDALIAIAGDIYVADAGLTRLHRLYLVNTSKNERVERPSSPQSVLIPPPAESDKGTRESRYEMLPLTREYALAELGAHPAFEREARERWVKWYLNYCQENGGQDWQDWFYTYNRLEEEWQNLLAVFWWCRDHSTYERYKTLCSFWTEYLHDFTNIYGYWTDRLEWLPWVAQTAEGCGELPVAAEALNGSGFTLTLQRKFKEAQEQLFRAWRYCEVASPKTQIAVAQNIGNLRLYQKVFQKEDDDAFYWLELAENLLKTAQLDESDRLRRDLTGLYYRGIASYGSNSETKDFQAAKDYLRQVIRHAPINGRQWQRAINYAQYYLAVIAVEEGQSAEAKTLLDTGFPVAWRNKDRRRMATYQVLYARFYRQQDNWQEACMWAKAALDGFERLGMQEEIDETRQLLQELECL